MDMKNRGMTLFIAVTIMGILLFVSFAVVNITIKSTLFASSGRDSQYAFYAADAGLECALYWDSKYDAFSTSSHPLLLDNTVYCAESGVMGTGQALYGTTTLGRIGLGGDTNPTSVFSFLMDQPNVASPCSVVTVYKYYIDSNSDGRLDRLMTYIKSRGYNTCDMGNPRRLERGVEVTY
jgi:hypothetical protein